MMTLTATAVTAATASLDTQSELDAAPAREIWRGERGGVSVWHARGAAARACTRAARTYPAAHAVHDVAAPPAEYVLALQVVHAPLAATYEPAAQLPPDEKGALQDADVEEPAGATSVDWHAVHDVDAPPGEYVLAPHWLHTPPVKK